MNAAVEATIETLLKLSQHDEQPDVQGQAIALAWDSSRESGVGYSDVLAFKLNLAADVEAINDLERLVGEARDMQAVLYTYRCCSKALPHVADADKDAAKELYQETFKILDAEMARLRGVLRWQADAGIARAVDALFLLDHVKNSKQSIAADFSVLKRVVGVLGKVSARKDADEEFQAYVSTKWSTLGRLCKLVAQIPGVEDLLVQVVGFCMDTLEGSHVVLTADRLSLLRALPPLLVLAAHNEKEGEGLFKKKLKLDRILRPLKREPVVPAFGEMYVVPASLLSEMSLFFRRAYELLPQISAMAGAHDDFCLRFAAATNQLRLLKDNRVKQTPAAAKELRGEVLAAVLEGLRLVARMAACLHQQFVWKAAHPQGKFRGDEGGQPPSSLGRFERLHGSGSGSGSGSGQGWGEQSQGQGLGSAKSERAPPLGRSVSLKGDRPPPQVLAGASEFERVSPHD
eukprot:jgi/Mesen1/946/ME000118S00123